MCPSAERNMLFGILAVHNGMIDPSALLAAFQAWTTDKSRPVAELLVGRGDIDADDRALLDRLVDRQIGRHGGDVEASVASLALGTSTREALRDLDESDADATLDHEDSAATKRDESDADATLDHEDSAATEREESDAAGLLGRAPGDAQRFRILRPHARGGLGAVYVALDAELNREVALKQILESHADEPISRTRFVLEAEITGGLEHPGIVPVYGLGSDGDGRPYYAMRFVRGVSLKDAIASFHGPEAMKADPGVRSLDLHKLLRRYVDVCNAIDYAHCRGVIHRDIKPANILVGRHGETLVVDWGLAKVVGATEGHSNSNERTLAPPSASGSAETLAGSALGTPSYMSPEQAAGRLDQLGPRSDVYSLGATLYCLLTGKPPIEAGDLGSLLKAVREGKITPPRTLDSSIDPALEAVCMKALALEPERRYATSRALADDVERWAADEPVAAWPEPFARRARRWARRNRTAVTASALTVVAALAVTTAVLVVQTRANRDLRDANQRVSKANRALNEAVERETAQFDLAMNAIRDSHERITDDVLMKQTESAPLRDKLLASSREFYRKLEASLAGKTDPRSRAALGRAYHALGDLRGKTGSTEKAASEYERAVNVRRALAVAPAADAESHSALARSLVALAGTRSEQVGQGRRMRALLEEARTHLKASAAERTDDPSARLDLARCLLLEAALDEVEGKLDAAGAAAEAGLRALESLAADHPDDRDTGLELAMALMTKGTRRRVAGRPLEAVALYEQARTVLERYSTAHPDDAEIKLQLGATYNLAGVVLGDELARIGEARICFERYRDILAPVVKANPGVLGFVTSLTVARYNIGRMLRNEGRYEEALALMKEVRDGNEVLARAHPDDGVFRYFLWIQNWHISEILGRLGRLPEALADARRSLEVAESTAAAQPSNLDYLVWIAQSNQTIADLLARMDRRHEALTYLDRALAGLKAYLARRPDDPLALDAFDRCLPAQADALHRAGRLEQAAALYHEGIALIEARGALNPNNLYNIACYRSRLSALGLDLDGPPAEKSRSSRAEADLAMVMLRKAVDSGFRDAAWMGADPDLAPLRDRDDFKMLLLDAAMPPDPFAP